MCVSCTNAESKQRSKECRRGNHFIQVGHFLMILVLQCTKKDMEMREEQPGSNIVPTREQPKIWTEFGVLTPILGILEIANIGA